MNKSVEAFRTIAEVADELGVPKHVLRFWEVKFPQIRPMKRGGGRRYYRPEDVELLRGIRALLHSDAYTIKGVQRILREEGVEHVKQAGREAAMPAGKRRRAPAAAKGEAGVAPQPPAAVAGPALRPSAVRAGARRAQPATASAQRRAAVASIIAELESCRALLRDGRTIQRAGSAASGVVGRGRADR